MAIPYNPSSFATNKTILQAIEELKNYLKDNPCYKVYYVNTPYVVGTYTYNLSDVDDPDDTMTEYDVVFFTNSYYAKVIVKDSTTFDIDPAVSFKGATGNTGPAGADGSDGVSITGATINASGHLIISLSNGNTVDAGAMPQATISSITLTSSSGTLTDSEYALLSDRNTYFIYEYSDYKIELRFKYENSTYLVYEDTHYTHNSVYARMFLLITKGTKAYAYSSTTRPFTENDINSISGTSGQVLTAGGDGTASWTTVSAGYENTVSITATSGTFTDSDFAKLGYGDSTIVYTDAYSVSTVYKLKLETASILEFEAIDAASRTNLKLIDVNKTTKAYSMTAISMITSSTISSGTATSGKVLTANGSGGTSWESVSVSSIEGTSVKSTGESSGKVLTSDGSGNASWQTTGGGITLTKYTFTTANTPSNSDYARIYRILNNAKSVVSIYNDTYSTNYYYGVWGTLIAIWGMQLSTTSLRFMRVTFASNGTISHTRQSYDFTNQVFTGDTVTSTGKFIITYYNDTEII